jgi:flagellar biosynthesis protein FlhB
MKKKIAIFGKDRTTFEIASIFVFVLVLVANLVAVRFAEGYFGYFNVPLSEVNFVPQMYDYVRIALPVIIGAVVVTVITFGLMGLSAYVSNFLARLLKPNKKAVKFAKRYKKFFESLDFVFDFLTKAVMWIGTGLVLWSMIYTFSANFGKTSAESMTKLSSISGANDNLQKVIIYKGVNELIVKNYDTSKNKFQDGYDVLYGSSYTTRTIDR